MSTKNENFNFLKSLFMASVSFISEQPSYVSMYQHCAERQKFCFKTKILHM